MSFCLWARILSCDRSGWNGVRTPWRKDNGIRSWLSRILEGFKRPPPGTDPSAADLGRFENSIGYSFRDRDLLLHALTHRSYAYQEGRDRRHSNERLEFLGDSVLGLLINEALVAEFEEADEGLLTKMKSLLVSGVVLADVSLSIKLGDMIRLSGNEEESGGRERESILSDGFEALLGAMYLDGGLEPGRRLIQNILLSRRVEFLSDDSHRNHKSLLQEKVQALYKIPPRYRIGATFGPDHSKDFIVEVIVRGEVLAQGSGRSKKEAEQDAARIALENFEMEAPDEVEQGGDEPSSSAEATEADGEGEDLA